jgi:hypothetical protein
MRSPSPRERNFSEVGALEGAFYRMAARRSAPIPAFQTARSASPKQTCRDEALMPKMGGKRALRPTRSKGSSAPIPDVGLLPGSGPSRGGSGHVRSAHLGPAPFLAVAALRQLSEVAGCSAVRA